MREAAARCLTIATRAARRAGTRPSARNAPAAATAPKPISSKRPRAIGSCTISIVHGRQAMTISASMVTPTTRSISTE